MDGRYDLGHAALNYYNENDPKAAQWLRDLIWVGAISDGEVDSRSIEDVTPNDLAGFKQCHFFAGIGGWSLALRLAGWPDTEPVWTGSCPCQPFSAAGKGGGLADERHLWPAFYHLIKQCNPTTVFGEQVASPDGLAWFDVVQADLEDANYAAGAADICAAGVGAPHIRQRLYWVAHSGSARQQLNAQRHGESKAGEPAPQRHDTDRRGDALWLADAGSAAGRGYDGDMGDANNKGSQGWGQRRNGPDKWSTWAASLVSCRDGKWRPVEAGTFPLAHGIPGRVGLLRGYGNAIVPQVAAEFIGAYLDTV